MVVMVIDCRVEVVRLLISVIADDEFACASLDKHLSRTSPHHSRCFASHNRDVGRIGVERGLAGLDQGKWKRLD